MSNVIIFPVHRLTPQDRERLAEAILGSPFDLEIGVDETGEAVAYLFRCAALKPSFEIKKTVHGWSARDLAEPGHHNLPPYRSIGALIRDLSRQPPLRRRSS